MSMSILPGQQMSAVDPTPPPVPPRLSAGRDRRVLAGVVAAAVLLAGGGAWYLLHSSGGSSAKTVAAASQVRHARVTPAHFATPRTPAEALAAATKVFAVLPAQLPGWQVSGKVAIDRSTSSDPISRSLDSCFASSNKGDTGLDVNSPTMSHATADPTNLTVQGQVSFARTAARAAKDFAELRRPASLRCMRAATIGRTIAIGHGGTLRFDSLRRLNVPRDVYGIEYDGNISSDVFGDQPVRVVFLAAPQGAAEITVISTGLGSALPLRADLRVLNAVRAQTRNVLG